MTSVVNGPAKRPSVVSWTVEPRLRSNPVQWRCWMVPLPLEVYWNTHVHLTIGSSVKPSTNAPGMVNGPTILPPANVSRHHGRVIRDRMTNLENIYLFAVITCEDPEVPTGSYVVGYDLNVHSVIEYHCEPGYLMHGEPRRTCENDGDWTGEVPHCECEYEGIFVFVHLV